MASSAISSLRAEREASLTFRAALRVLKLSFAMRRRHVLQPIWNVNVAASNERGFMKLSLLRQWQARLPKNFTSPSNSQHQIMQKRVIWLHLLAASLAAHPAMKWSSSLHFGRSSIPFANKLQLNRMQDASPALNFCCAKRFPRISRSDRQFNGNRKQKFATSVNKTIRI